MKMMVHIPLMQDIVITSIKLNVVMKYFSIYLFGADHHGYITYCLQMLLV